MENRLDHYFLTLPEPQQSALLFLRHFFMTEMQLEENWKYNTPFYYYKEKWFCYLSYNKKRNHEIYIGFVKGHLFNHPKLHDEGRKLIKRYYVNPEKDINQKELTKIIHSLFKFYPSK